MYKKILSLVLVITMLAAMSVHVFAVAKTEIATETELLMSETEAQCILRYQNANSYYSGDAESLVDTVVSMQMYKDNTAVTLNLSTQEASYHFTGNLLAANGGGYFDGKLVLGDFEMGNVYNVVLFKALYQGEESCITILLENLLTSELIELVFELPQEVFYSFEQAANILSETKVQYASVTYDEDETMQRFLRLYMPSKNFASEENARVTSSLASETFKNTDSNTGVGVTHTTLKNFIAKVEDGDIVRVTNSAVQNMLCQSDWSFYKSSTHFYVSYGIAVSDTEYVMAIILTSVSKEHESADRKLSTSYQITGRITLSYDSELQEATLMYLDAGIRLENPLIALELVGGSTYFTETSRTYDLETSKNAFDLLCAIADDLGTAASIWNALFTVETQSSETRNWGSESAQIDRYGAVVRAAAFEADDGCNLTTTETYIGMTSIYSSSGTYSSYRIAYRFTAVSII